MKKLATLLAVGLMTAGAALADDAVFVNLANQLADQASAAIDAATPGEEDCQTPKFRNWRLRGNIKDIRKVALKFRDRAARGKARTLVSKLKVKQIKANMRTCNFLYQNGAAKGLDAFAPAWSSVRETIGEIVAEMCCGGDQEAGDKSKDF